MKSKILVIESQTKPLARLRKLFKKRSFQIIRPKETESIFNICKTEKLAAVVVDPGVYGERSARFLQNLRDHILPENVKLLSVAGENLAEFS
ncbi:hypothetical protein [Kaistella palustris]|uniref:hypothetical protein n=1 Tax=Kaistella palustris TaxID=493376 RepID=UPI000417DB4F|nr:hypothetical protein [Kaistella palustris]